MKRNVSNLDRWVRVGLGVVLAGAGLATGGWLALVLYVVAAVLLVTAAVAFCPLYKLLGIDTCAMSKTCAQP
jgi:uncharacterized membrane protein